MLVVWFDPGVTVGWAAFKKPENQVRYQSGQIRHQQTWRFLNRIHSSAELEDRRLIIGYEDFKYIPHLDKAVLTPVENIGVIREWCRQHDIQPHVQQPAQKDWYTDHRLRGMGLYKPGKPHANDAMRHLLYFLGKIPRKEDE